MISEAARSFLAARTERFVVEVELFLASGLNIEAYDSVCKQRLRLKQPNLWGSEAEEGGVCQHESVIPYLYVFDEDENVLEDGETPKVRKLPLSVDQL